MNIIKVKLKKPKYAQDTQHVSLYGYGENSTNDAPKCDANGNTTNCRC